MLDRCATENGEAEPTAAPRRAGHGGWCAVEPFEHVPDGPGVAARAIGHLRGLKKGTEA